MKGTKVLQVSRTGYVKYFESWLQLQNYGQNSHFCGRFENSLLHSFSSNDFKS